MYYDRFPWHMNASPSTGTTDSYDRTMSLTRSWVVSNYTEFLLGQGQMKYLYEMWSRLLLRNRSRTVLSNILVSTIGGFKSCSSLLLSCSFIVWAIILLNWGYLESYSDDHHQILRGTASSIRFHNILRSQLNRPLCSYRSVCHKIYIYATRTVKTGLKVKKWHSWVQDKVSLNQKYRFFLGWWLL